MNKVFFAFSTYVRWGIALAFALLLAVILGYWIYLVDSNPIWVLLIFIVVPLIQFFSTPVFIQFGYYTYYAPMVVQFGKSVRVIDLHNGSSFDYLLDMRKVKPGIQWKNQMLLHYMYAFQRLISLIEQEQLDQKVQIRGSSYFFSQRTAERFGFQTFKTSWFEQLNLALNYLDLIWTYSLANGRFKLPNLKNTQTVRISGSDLIKQKAKIEAYLDRLEKVG